MSKDRMEELVKFRTSLKRLMATADGVIVKEGLHRMYVEQSAFASTTEETHYRLGQKEFVQGLMRDSESELDTLTTLENNND